MPVITNLKITKLPPNQWQQYRNLRLEALQTDPHAFGSSYKQEHEMFETEWQTRINNIWFAVVNDKPIGLIGLLHGSGPGTYCGELISLWVKPEYRGQGIGKRLIEHLQQYASDQRLRKLYLQVTSTQKAAINLYRTRGFTHIGTFKDHAFYEGHFFDKWVMEWLI